MKLIISLIFYFFASSSIIFKNGEASISYESLIGEVYDEYRTSGIIIATPNYRSFEKITTFQIILKAISARGIGSVIVKFMQLGETMKFHHRRLTRPLVAIFIEKMTEIEELKEGIVNIDMNYPVWLILFTGDEHEDSCEYCRNPIESPFATNVLVSCCNLSSIVKWNSKKNNYSTSSFQDVKIEKINEIKRYPNRSLFSSRQSPVRREFRIMISPDPNCVWKSGNRLHGYMGEIVMELSRVMNFSITQVSEDVPGVFQPETSTWTGIMGIITQGKAEIGIGTFATTPTRLDIVDFSSTLVFHPKIWMVIALFLLISPSLLIIIEYKKNCNLYDLISVHYLNVLGLFCQQSWSTPPRRNPSKIIFLSLFISTLVVNAGYSAALIRQLTTAPPYVQFRTLQEFVNDGTYEVIAARGSAMHNWIEATNDTLVQKLKNMMKPSNRLPISVAEGFRQLCSEKVAFIYAKSEGNFRREHPPCKCMSFKVGGTINTGMIFPLNSDYTGPVNYHIQRFRENGMLNRLKRKYFVKFNRTDVSYATVSFEDIIPVLTIFAIGCLIALIILNYEKR